MPAAANASGLSTVIDTIASPADAFERQRSMPTWGWALVIALALLLVGAYLQAPAGRHVAVISTQKMLATSTLVANMSDAQKQQAVERAGKPSIFTYVGPIVVLFLAVFFNTIILLLGNAIGRGQADFKRLWCGSMNIAVPTLGLGAVVLGIITMVRGADSFDSSLSLARAVPGLALLVPNGSAVLIGFLSSISIFTIWGFFLNATMMRVTAKTSPAVAYTFAAVVLLLGALLAAGGVAVAHNFGAA
ncbi:MAG TPA: YIP1 family protein [Candidatus Baltobacteraceae bacterium]